jgi:hypothetical protein
MALASQQEAQSVLLQAQVDLFDAAVPADIDQEGLFRLFDELSKSYDVELTTLQITRDEQAAGASDMAFTDGAAPATGGGTEGAGGPTTTLPPVEGPAGGDAAAPSGSTLALRTVQITTAASGPFAQVLDFIDALRSADRLFVIDDLSLAPESPAGDRIVANLSLRTFAKPAETTAATGAAGTDPTMSFEEVGP